MGSSFSGINVLVSALRAQTLAQQIIQNNIANATTTGYSRQIPILSSVPYLNVPSLNSVFSPGQIGMGVTLQSIERVRDEFLNLQIRRELSAAGMQNALADAAEYMKIIFPELNESPGSGFVTMLDRFFTSFSDLAASAADSGLRALVVDNGVALTQSIRDAYKTLRDLQVNQDQQVRAGVIQVNALLLRIAEANRGIVSAMGAGGSANALMDSRDTALVELSRLMRIDTVRLGDGSVLVMTGNARVLVNGGDASRLSAGMTAHEPRFASVDLYDARNNRIGDITGEVESGTMGGLLQARDGLVADEMLEMDKLAHSLVQQVNLLHHGGYAATGGGVTTGVDFLTGTASWNIDVASAVRNDPGMVAASARRGNATNGEQAETLGALKYLSMNSYVQSIVTIEGMTKIDPTASLATISGDFAVAPSAGGSIWINNQRVDWDQTMSLEDIVEKINDSVPGVRASFEYSRVDAGSGTTEQIFTIIADGPLTVYDDMASGSNLTAVLNLQVRVNSLAQINNVVGPDDRKVDRLVPLSSAALQYRTLAAVRGYSGGSATARQIEINGVVMDWKDSQPLRLAPTGILNVMNTGPNLGSVRLGIGFDETAQSVYILGQQVLPAYKANPIGPVNIRDVAGNLSMVFNMEGQPTFGGFTDTMLARMQAQISNTGAATDQADAAVEQLQLQQDAISQVNLDEEKARLLEYLRAYEASVRAMAAMDEMLNVLINRMAVSTMGASTSSVLSS